MRSRVAVSVASVLLVSCACTTADDREAYPAGIDALRASGASVGASQLADDPVPTFSGDHQTVCLEHQLVTLYSYDDPIALARDVNSVQVDGTVDGVFIDREGRLGVWTGDDVIAVYFGTNVETEESLEAAFGPTLTPDATPRGSFGGVVDQAVLDADTACP